MKWLTVMNMIVLVIFGICSIYISPAFIILVGWVLYYLYEDEWRNS
jgi:hypothetical protein